MIMKSIKISTLVFIVLFFYSIKIKGQDDNFYLERQNTVLEYLSNSNVPALGLGIIKDGELL